MFKLPDSLDLIQKIDCRTFALEHVSLLVNIFFAIDYDVHHNIPL